MCSDKSAGAAGLPELPELLSLDPAASQVTRHPVLREVLADLRARVAGEPAVRLWVHDEDAQAVEDDE
ncbi:FxSxx-COOH cyclophane-containing RiPP peptide [Streptomyces xiamenensis]|uniref:FXSXX-COOH protein n=1 Tax=Streptomyces xiamenensis TaxID=408015 RepID=UPI0036B72819